MSSTYLLLYNICILKLGMKRDLKILIIAIALILKITVVLNQANSQVTIDRANNT